MTKNEQFIFEDERFIFCNKTTDSNVWDTLKKECYSWEYVVSLLNNLNNENQHLKEALKELKKIDDYKEMRIQELHNLNNLIEDEIDKKIAVLTDAKIKSIQNEDEELFGKIKFSIQVLRELKETEK